MNKLYRIKPLEWHKLTLSNCVIHRCRTPLGPLAVTQMRDRECWWEHGINGESAMRGCDSLEHGKQLAEEEWRRRLESVLEVAILESDVQLAP